jgi:hypothetical protein
LKFGGKNTFFWRITIRNRLEFVHQNHYALFLCFSRPASLHSAPPCASVGAGTGQSIVAHLFGFAIVVFVVEPFEDCRQGEGTGIVPSQSNYRAGFEQTDQLAPGQIRGLDSPAFVGLHVERSEPCAVTFKFLPVGIAKEYDVVHDKRGEPLLKEPTGQVFSSRIRRMGALYLRLGDIFVGFEKITTKMYEKHLNSQNFIEYSMHRAGSNCARFYLYLRQKFLQ